MLHAIQPSSPLEWIQLIILFDQMPRNIYRGEESSIVFTVFDPISQHIAQAATAAGVQKHPEEVAPFPTTPPPRPSRSMLTTDTSWYHPDRLTLMY